MALTPDFSRFEQRYLDGEAQLVRTTLVGDLETPVSAYLKLTAKERRKLHLF